MENDYGVIDLWVLKAGGGYKEIERKLLKQKSIESYNHKEIYRDESKVISEQGFWDSTWIETDTQFEWDCDGSERKAWEERKPEYFKNGFNYFILSQREWKPGEYDKFIEKNGYITTPFLSMCIENAEIIYSDIDNFKYNVPYGK